MSFTERQRDMGDKRFDNIRDELENTYVRWTLFLCEFSLDFRNNLQPPNMKQKKHVAFWIHHASQNFTQSQNMNSPRMR